MIKMEEKMGKKETKKAEVKAEVKVEKKAKQNYGSILGLATSHTMKPVLWCSLLLMIVQGCTFAYLGMKQGEVLIAFYQWIEHPLIRYSFIVVMLVVLEASYRVGTDNANPGYTMQRLGVKEKTVFRMWMLNAICSIGIIWGVQLLIIFLSGKYYEMVTPEHLTSVQTMFLSSYRSDFFHTIMPVEDWSMWIRNIALVFAMSSGIAKVTVKRFRGVKSSIMLGFEVFLIVLYFNIGSGSWDVMVTACLLICSMFMIYGGAIYEA